MPRPATTRPTSRFDAAPRGDLLERRPAHEVARLVELDDATEPRLERVGRRGRARCRRAACPASSRSVSRAPRPTGDEPVRRRPRVEQRVPRSVARSRVDEHLEPVLARVAGPRDERRDPGDLALGDRVIAERGEVDVGQRREDVDARAGPGSRRAPVASDRSSRTAREAVEPRGELVGHDVRVGGVGDDQEPLLGRAGRR